jgi:hypothetical protein
MQLSTGSIDFGYPWWLSYGHVPLLAVAAFLLVIGGIRKWSNWSKLLLAVFALWSAAAFTVERFVFDINRPPHCRPKPSCVREPGAYSILEPGPVDHRLWSSDPVLRQRSWPLTCSLSLSINTSGTARLHNRNCSRT